MDPTKKRKLDENGLTAPDPAHSLTPADARKVLEPLSHDQLLEILQTAVINHPDVLAAVRAHADRDISQRKLFVRGLGWETTNDSLKAVFSVYGELEEAVVILDKTTGKSKGYGFVIYKHIDGAILALKQSSKQIDGRVAVAALASAGLSGGGPGGGVGGGMNSDTALRKIYVGNVPQDMPAERLLSVFASFGEIEEGPLGFDKATGKSKGFALFVYKTQEAAQAALLEPMKVIDGRQLICKLASEGKKGKPGGDPLGMPPPSGPGSGPYTGSGGPGGYSSSSGFSGMGQQMSNPMNSSYNPSVGQVSAGYGGNAGYGSGGGYGGGPNSGGYGAPNTGGYGGYGGGAGSGGVGGGMGTGGAGRGDYGMPPPNSGGMPAGGGYSDGGHYGLSSGGYPNHQHQPTGTSPAPRVPPGGVGGYPNPPPYY